MKKVILFGLLIVIFALTSCVEIDTSIPSQTAESTKDTTVFVPIPEITPKQDTKPIESVQPTEKYMPSQVIMVPGLENTMIDSTWISPAEVMISNYYPGATAEYNIRVHNGSENPVKFSVSYRIPDNVRKGYDAPLSQVQDWVMITDPTPIIGPKETKEVLVVLAVPKDEVIDSKQWEFWISAMEKQVGMVQTEMAIRWLISMR